MSVDTTELKRRNDIEAVIVELTGYEMQGGRKYKKPVDGTKEGGLVINVDEQMYFWNSRNRGGDVIDFLIQEQGYDFMGACEWLASRAGVVLHVDEATQRRLAAERRRQHTLTTVMQWLVGKFEQSDAAAAYCEARGWHAETVQAARLGFWDGDRRGLADMCTMEEIRVQDDMVQAVMAIPAGMLIYGHWEAGRCVYLSGRSIEGKQHYNPKQKFMGARRPFWNHVRPDRWVVVVEGQADAITLGQWGVPAVALAGTHADTRLIDQLAEFDRVYVAPDADSAGQETLATLADPLAERAFVISWPQKDANDWLLAGATADDCHALLNQADNYVLWLALHYRTITDSVQRDAMRAKILELMAKLGTVQYALLREDVKDALGVSLGTLNQATKAVKERLLNEQRERERREAERRLNEDDLWLRSMMIKESPDHEGHAQCVMAAYPNQFAFVPEWGWLVHRETHWQRDGAEAEVERCITAVLRQRQRVARGVEDDFLASKSAADHYVITGVRLQLQSAVTRSTDEFDNNPNLLNCANGVLDLRTGELEPHHPKQMMTYCLEVPYAPEADDAQWLSFLYSVIHDGDDVDGTQAVIDWLQEVVGYCLTGHTREDSFFYLYGPSRSGKGTFTNTLLTLLGRPLSNSVNISTFTADRGQDTQNFDLAPLRPARLIVASEAASHKRLNATNLKSMTGEDYLWCSYKGKDHFSYLPQFKIWIASNFPLNMDADDSAAWARARVLHFPHSHVGREDRSLKRRLVEPENLRGVLAWAVAGARRWYERGKLPATPDRIADMTSEMRGDQDLVGVWMAEQCAVADPLATEIFTPTEMLLDDYRQWCKLGGVRPKGYASFRQSLIEKKYEPARRRHWKYDNARAGFSGIQLQGDEEPTPQGEQSEIPV